MDKNIEILLGSQKNIASVNKDTYDKIELTNNVSEIMEYDVNDAVNSTEVFDAEREANSIYRIYGRVEYLSLLNGLKNDQNNLNDNYKILEDFFNPKYVATSKNIQNSFQFYLVRPAESGYTKIDASSQAPTTTLQTSYIINENFNNWVTASPSNYPYGWGISVSTGSYAQQASGDRAQLFFDNNLFFFTPWNLITLYKDVPTLSGQFFIEVDISSVSPAYNPLTDGITLMLANIPNGTLVKSIPLTTGYQRIEVNLPTVSAITRISIFGNVNSANKSFYFDYFKVYKTGYTTSGGGVAAEGYARYFKVIATPNDFELYPAGFSNNVYGEQTYAFSFKKDFDISQYFDNFGFPLTELFLYAQYNLKKNGNNLFETMQYTKWDSGGNTKEAFPTSSMNIGNYVKTASGAKIGDLIDYQINEFIQIPISGQTIYITTEYKDNFNQSRNLIWKFNPFMPLRLRYLANELSSANINSTSYDLVESIPDYATLIDSDGNYVWRTIVPQGYIEPLTGLGVDYPFLNKRRYLFAQIILDIVPDLSDANTENAFKQIWYSRNATNLNITPEGDLDNIGKPCR